MAGFASEYLAGFNRNPHCGLPGQDSCTDSHPWSRSRCILADADFSCSLSMRCR